MSPEKKTSASIKNKFLRKFAKDNENAAKKILSSDDPLAELGTGIITFHRFLLGLIVLFFVLTIIHMPVLNTFMRSNFFKNEPDIFLQSTLGNLGFSQTACI